MEINTGIYYYADEGSIFRLAYVWAEGNLGKMYTLLGLSFSFQIFLITKKWKWFMFNIFISLIIGASIGMSSIFFAAGKDSKPAIYIYPKEEIKVNVQLDIKGELTKVIPEYKKDGWNVKVKPNGDMKVIGGNSQITYDYLFYENTVKKIDLPEEGWIIAKKDLKVWFNNNIYKMGLNKKEGEEFIEFWVNKLNKENSKFILIKLMSDEYLKENMKLTIIPKPDKVLRIEFYFEGVDKKTEMKEPKIKGFKRTGYYAVEWGGIMR